MYQSQKTLHTSKTINNMKTTDTSSERYQKSDHNCMVLHFQKLGENSKWLISCENFAFLDQTL